MIEAKHKDGFIIASINGTHVPMQRQEAIILRDSISIALREELEHRMAIMDTETAAYKARAAKAKGEA